MHFLSIKPSPKYSSLDHDIQFLFTLADGDHFIPLDSVYYIPDVINEETKLQLKFTIEETNNQMTVKVDSFKQSLSSFSDIQLKNVGLFLFIFKDGENNKKEEIKLVVQVYTEDNVIQRAVEEYIAQ
ncbi:hypothetical protein WA158_005143 [Blastocystis sp. Blastoise]